MVRQAHHQRFNVYFAIVLPQAGSVPCQVALRTGEKNHEDCPRNCDVSNLLKGSPAALLALLTPKAAHKYTCAWFTPGMEGEVGSISKSSFALIVAAAAFVATLAVAAAMYNSTPAREGQVPTTPATASTGAAGQNIGSNPSSQPAAFSLPTPEPRVLQQGTNPPAPVATPLPRPTATLIEPATSPPTGGSSAPSPETSTPVAEAVAPLGDRFVTAFHFVAATDTWVYYDPEFPEEGTLKAMVSGQEYLILVTESVTLEVNGQQLELACSNNDCWNTVVWP